MPMDKSCYPNDWPAISKRIRERDDQKCTVCGVANFAVGARDRFGNWHDENRIDGMNSTEGFSLWPGGYPEPIRIVLTVAHLDGADTMDCRDEVLASMCQKCHFAHDRTRNVAKARQTRLTKGGLQTAIDFPAARETVRLGGERGGEG